MEVTRGINVTTRVKDQLTVPRSDSVSSSLLYIVPSPPIYIKGNFLRTRLGPLADGMWVVTQP